MSETETEQGTETTEAPAVPDETPQEPTEAPETPAPDETIETPDETPEPDETPAPQAPPPSETPEALEKRAKSGEQRFQRYGRGIEELYEGTSTRLVGCPLCPDQHKGFVDLNFAGRIPEEVQANVKMYLGLAREIEYKPSRKYHTCAECEGEGKVDTGSHVATQKTISCDECNGRGYVPPPGPAPQNGLTGPTTYTPEQLEQFVQARDDVDEWNEPRILPDGRENPNFGRMPNRKILVEPWGVTAGLNVLDAVG